MCDKIVTIAINLHCLPKFMKEWAISACCLGLGVQNPIFLVSGNETRSDEVLQKANFDPRKIINAMLLGSNSVGTRCQNDIVNCWGLGALHIGPTRVLCFVTGTKCRVLLTAVHFHDKFRAHPFIQDMQNLLFSICLRVICWRKLSTSIVRDSCFYEYDSRAGIENQVESCLTTV